MADKVYHLCVELDIDGQKRLLTLSRGNLLALEKYTSFCSGPVELLRTMPDKESFSSKNFLDRYLSNLYDKNDPFSIRTSSSRGSKKLPLFYKSDEDLLLINKEEIIQSIRGNYKFTIDDVENNNINGFSEEFLKKLWDLFYDSKIMTDFYEYVDCKLDPDKRITFDARYEKVLKNKWMILGLSKTVLEKFIKLIYKDPRKRIEFFRYLKDNYKELIPRLDAIEKQKRLGLLEKEQTKKGTSTKKIRRQIDDNLSELDKQLKKVVPEVPIITMSKPYVVTEQDIISYNEKRKDNTFVMERIISLSKELENLKRELLVVNSLEIKEKINNRISEVEFEIYELENNRYCYTDNGELIKEDEMKK